MANTHSQIINPGWRRILLIVFLPLIMFLVIVQTLKAQDENDPQIVTAAQLSAAKDADVTQISPGETVHYTISISNTGNTSAPNSIMTDTLPAEFEYVTGTLSAIGGFDSLSVVDNVVIWTGSVSGNGGAVQIEFDAVLTDTVLPGDIITNTAQITGSGQLLTPFKEITVEAKTYTIFMPIIMKALDPISLLSVSKPTSTDGWTTYNMLVTWQKMNGTGVNYILQIADNAQFSNPIEVNAGSATSYSFSRTAKANFPNWHFRVRYQQFGLTSNWSNILTQIGAYHDDFNDPSSGWSMRRHDTDDTNDSTKYQDGMFKMKVGGRWDSMIAGPLVSLPTTWNGYQIETNVILEDGIDISQSYGIVFGADWDGVSPCPSPSFLTCYNRYYRLNVVWGYDGLTAKLKRVDSHNPGDNTDTGITLMSYREVPNVSNSKGWNRWTIQVFNDGTINLFINGQHFYTAHDTSYVGGGKYFGTFASSAEYLGTAAWYQYYKITPLP